MASVADNVMRFFRSSSAQASAPAVPQKRSRRSSGIAEISRLLNSQDPLRVLDLGSTSANNIRFLTAKGHKNYSEDLLQASLDPAIQVKNETGKLDPRWIEIQRLAAELLARLEPRKKQGRPGPPSPKV